MKALYALYSEPDAAQRAVDNLRATGVADRDIVVISSEPIEEYEFSHRDKATWLPWIAAAGGVAGMCLGFWLTRMTQLAWPLRTGNMPIVAMWPNLVVTFELTMLCGILATFVALLVSAGLPGRKPGLYDSEVTGGKILVGVENPPEGSVSALERALLDGGAGRLKTIS